MRFLLVSLLVWLMAVPAWAVPVWTLSSGDDIVAALFARTEGFQTTPAEIARGTGAAWDADVASMEGHATTARDAWPYDIRPGEWSTISGQTTPDGQTPGAQFNIRNASTDVLAMALACDTANDDSYCLAARTRLLEFAATTGFDPENLSGSNETIIDLATAVANLIEAALYLEAMGYQGWTQSDRIALSNWSVDEVFPVLSWALNRKNNWWTTAAPSLLAIAGMVEGHRDTITPAGEASTTPAAFISGFGTRLAEFLSTSTGDELDSACEAAGEIFGIQSNGAAPDENRRTGGTANCGQTSIAFDCTDSTTCASAGAHFYGHKLATGLAHTFEVLRRLDGDGARGFDLTSHGGDSTVARDVFEFYTGGDFQTYFVPDTTQGARYVLSSYERDGCIAEALDDGDVSVRGGRDYPYTRITHASGVANPLALDSCIPDGTPIATIHPEIGASNATWNSSELAWETTMEISEADGNGGDGGFGTYGGIISLSDVGVGWTYDITVDIKVPAAPFDPAPIPGSSTEFDQCLKNIRIRTNNSGGTNAGYIDAPYRCWSQPTNQSPPPNTTLGLIKENDPGTDIWTYIAEPLPQGEWHTFRAVVTLDNVSRDLGGDARIDFYVDGNLVGTNGSNHVTLVAADDVANSVYLFTYYNGTPLERQVRYFRNFSVTRTPPPSPFVSMAASSLSSIPEISRQPNSYVPPRIDDSLWTRYDMTCEEGTACTPAAGTAAFPSGWGCDAMVGDGTTDDGPAFGCMMAAAPAQTTFYVPDGVYLQQTPFGGAGRNIWRPQSADTQIGIECQSWSTEFAIDRGRGAPIEDLIWIEGEDMEVESALTWINAASSRGSTTIMAPTATLAIGDKVRLRADPNIGEDQNDQDEYLTSVASITNSATFEISHPLPENMTGANATVERWTPMEDFFIRGCTLRNNRPLHTDFGLDEIVTLRNIWNAEIENNSFLGIVRTGLLIQGVANPRIVHNQLTDVHGDKGANNYTMLLADTSRGMVADNLLTGNTCFAFGGGVQETLVVANACVRPPQTCPDVNLDGRCDDSFAPAFDEQCTESLEGDGGTNDCIVDQAFHAAAHGPTVSAAEANALCVVGDEMPCCNGTPGGDGSCAAAYTHCRITTDGVSAYRDLMGYTGDTGCHGAPTGAIYSCAEWHNSNASDHIFARNYCEAPIWTDDNNGATENVWLVGNTISDFSSSGAPLWNTAPGEAGDFHRRIGEFGPASFEDTTVYIGNVWEGDFGSGGSAGYNVYGNGIASYDQAIAGTLFYQSASDPSGSRGTAVFGGAPDGVNDTFVWTIVGDDHHNGPAGSYGSTETGGYSRTIPTVPGLSDWPVTFMGPASGTAPFAGVDVGDPDVTPHCVPAYERFFGSCPP